MKKMNLQESCTVIFQLQLENYTGEGRPFVNYLNLAQNRRQIIPCKKG